MQEFCLAMDMGLMIPVPLQLFSSLQPQLTEAVSRTMQVDILSPPLLPFLIKLLLDQMHRHFTVEEKGCTDSGVSNLRVVTVAGN